MPELPDIEAYCEALHLRVEGQKLEDLRLASPFLLRSVEPPLEALVGARLVGAERLGKRIVLAFEGQLFCVLHLMVAGRLHWRKRGAALPGKRGLLALDFEQGSLVLTEAGSKRRASLHLVHGRAGLADHDPGGLELAGSEPAALAEVLTRENHTLKRALTDPRAFSGIGGAYADEILHRARLSPLTWTSRLKPEEIERLHAAAVEVLEEWRERLCAEARQAFPEKVSAFREGMAVHGRYGQACPECGAPVQRIVYASRETNYCAVCQTGGKVLADRLLSRLLKDDWPRILE